MRMSRPALFAASAASLSAACVVAMAGTAMAADVHRSPATAAVPAGGPPDSPTRPVATTPPTPPTPPTAP